MTSRRRMTTLGGEMKAWAAGVLVMWTGCAPAGHSDRPPAPAPPPSTAMISTLGFDQAVQMGSDYVKKSMGVADATLIASQELSPGILQLTFDLGPGKFPVRLTMDRGSGQVMSTETLAPGVVQPAR